MPTTIDHLTITAPNLKLGRLWVENLLGVPMQAGGEHPAMGTHNCLLRLGDDVFLEVICANLSVAIPARPRWFALDTLPADAAPRLATWVARSKDIAHDVNTSTERLGAVTPMSRGALNWHMTIPDDGALVLNGCAPALIAWSVEPHPASKMTDVGCQLQGLILRHEDPQRLERLLDSIECTSAINVLRRKHADEPSLEALIKTPTGLKRLSV